MIRSKFELQRNVLSGLVMNINAYHMGSFCYTLFSANHTVSSIFLKIDHALFGFSYTNKFIFVLLFNRSFRLLLLLAGFSRSYSISRFRLFWRSPLTIFCVIVVTISSDQNGSFVLSLLYSVSMVKSSFCVRPSIVEGGDRWEQIIWNVSVQAPIDGLVWYQPL